MGSSISVDSLPGVKLDFDLHGMKSSVHNSTNIPINAKIAAVQTR
ncbi:MAG TPA: hypothetical protein VMS43_14680 [Allosphingosinicella sp.]|nr:hypothetical protein [Allosphingosinicella sp.]